MSRILGINSSVESDRGWRVSRSEGELLEDLLLQRAIGIDRIEVSIFAVSVDDPVGVDGHRIDAPFKAGWMIADTRNRAVWLASATQLVCILETPLNVQILI